MLPLVVIRPLSGGGALDGFDSPARYLPSAATQRARQAALPPPEQLRTDLAQAGQVESPQVDPGEEVTEAWWDDMLVQWFDVPEEEKPAGEAGGESADSDPTPTVQSKA